MIPMADKKKDAVSVEKVYTIPLRSAWKGATRVKKTKRSVSAVRQFVEKHTKAEDVKISEKLNSALWVSGAKKPLHKVMVKVNVSEGKASVRLPEEITLEEEKKRFLEEKKKKKAPEAEEPKAEEKKEEAPAEKPEEKAEPAKEEAKPAEEKEEKPVEEPKAEKK